MKFFDKEVDNPKRIFGLDFLRALAIILVVLAHTLQIIIPKYFPSYLSALPPYFGIYGVEIFFVLSGFLIGTIIIKNLNETEEYDFKKIKHFWIRRWFRTLPNYYLIFFIFLLFDGFSLLKDLPIFFRYLIFFQNFYGMVPNFFGVSWSLAIEEWFYLLFPITLFIVTKTNSKKYRSLWITTILFIIITLIFRGYFAFSDLIYNLDNPFRNVVVTRLDAIAIGVLAGLINYYHKDFWEKNKKLFFILGICFLILSILLLILINNNSFIMKTFFYTYLSFSIAFLFPLTYSMNRFKLNYFTRLITHISLISYSIYLIHTLIYELIYNAQIKTGFINPTLGFFIILLYIFIISTFQYRLFEKPMTRLRERFSNDKKTEK